MAIKVIEKVFKHKVGDPTAKLVLLKLADCCNEEGKSCFPSVRTIAFQTDLTTRSVVNKIKYLEKHKYIKIKRGGKTVNNSYRINIKALTENVDVVKRFHPLKDLHEGSENNDIEGVNVVAHNRQVNVIEPTYTGEKDNKGILEEIREEENDPNFVPF